MSKGLLKETLDILAPAQEGVPAWEDVLAYAGIENPAPARRPLWKRSWVIALAVLIAVLVPLAAIGSKQNWWFLDNGSPKPGMPKPVSGILEVKSGSWSGHGWQLAAYRALVRQGGVGPGIDGVCYSVQLDHGMGGEGVCAPIPPQLSGAGSESPAPDSITFFGGSFEDSQGAQGDKGFMFGMVPSNAAKVEIHFKGGRAIDTPTFLAPEQLGAPVGFFGVELPEYKSFSSISKLVGLDGDGRVVACSADPKSLETCGK